MNTSNTTQPYLEREIIRYVSICYDFSFCLNIRYFIAQCPCFLCCVYFTIQDTQKRENEKKKWPKELTYRLLLLHFARDCEHVYDYAFMIRFVFFRIWVDKQSNKKCRNFYHSKEKIIAVITRHMQKLRNFQNGIRFEALWIFQLLQHANRFSPSSAADLDAFRLEVSFRSRTLTSSFPTQAAWCFINNFNFTARNEIFVRISLIFSFFVL